VGGSTGLRRPDDALAVVEPLGERAIAGMMAYRALGIADDGPDAVRRDDAAQLQQQPAPQRTRRYRAHQVHVADARLSGAPPDARKADGTPFDRPAKQPALHDDVALGDDVLDLLEPHLRGLDRHDAENGGPRRKHERLRRRHVQREGDDDAEAERDRGKREQGEGGDAESEGRLENLRGTAPDDSFAKDRVATHRGYN